MRQMLTRFTLRVTPTQVVKVVDDPDDDRIIECALAGGSDYIVTNDKALLRLEAFQGIEIVGLSEFFKHVP
jgi:predicted nucleic acid-binding protein